MLRNILIPLEGSPSAMAALDYGIQLAHDFGAELVGVGLVDEMAIRRAEAVPLGGFAFKQERDDAFVNMTASKVREQIQHFSSRCSAESVSFSTLEVRDCAVSCIVAEAERADLIVMGTERAIAPLETSSSETIKKVARKMPRPLIAVPGEVRHGHAVVVAYDGSLPASHTLPALASLGLGERWPVHVLTVSNSVEQAAAMSQRAVDFLRLHNVDAVQHTLVSTEPAIPAIFRFAEELGARLLVMGSNGHSPLRKLFYGSWTDWALENTRVPLLLYR